MEYRILKRRDLGKNIVKILLILLIIIVVDILIRLLIQQNWFSKFQFSYELNPSILFSSFLTAIVTLFAAWYISKKIKEQRFEKDFLLKDLIDIEQDICRIQTLITPGSIDSQEFIDILNNIQRITKRFKHTLNACGRENSGLTSLNAKYKVLYTKLTNTDSDYLDVNDDNKGNLMNYSDV